MKNFYHSSFLLFFVVLIIPLALANWNPYEILGVRPDASLDQIKKAYRDLARKVHPDKSTDSEDENGRRFIELNKAFNILKDPERRNRFDQDGDTGEIRNRNLHGHQHQNRQAREYYSHDGFRTFTFFSSSDGRLRKRSINTRQYYNDYLKESNFRPFFIFFYTDFCPSCSMIESPWIKITDELAKFNIGSFTINVHHEPRLSQDLGVNSIPHIACLIDGQIHPYYQPELSLSNIVKFVKALLPRNLLISLENVDDQDRFIASGPQQNRLSAIIIHNDNNLRLRYLLLAFELRQYYKFGHVSTKTSNYKLMTDIYNLPVESRTQQTYLLVFDENISRPVLNLNFKSDDVDMIQIKKKLIAWPFIQLPKLSSQQRFDDLCIYTIPKDSDRTKVRLCVILFIADTPSSLPTRMKMMEFIKMNNLYHDDRVVFSFIDPKKQREFVIALLAESVGTYPFGNYENIDSAILMIERHQLNSNKAHYKWVSAKWDLKNPNELDKAKLNLYNAVDSYKKSSFILQDKIALTSLIDEEGPNLITRIFRRFIDYTTQLMYNAISRETVSVILLVTMCVLFASFILNHSPITPVRTDSAFTPDQIDGPPILELKMETYNGMVRLLKPGCRSIVLLTDRDTRDKLIPVFKKAVWPYRRNKSLLFGYLCLDKNLEWYKSLLKGILGVEDLRVNKRNCIGTVLSLNGFKKYFRVYHAKHHEIDTFDNDTDNDGSFLGFDDDRDDDLENSINHKQPTNNAREIYSIDNLLDRLPIWLDKMFDGLTKRYLLDNWPSEMK